MYIRIFLFLLILLKYAGAFAQLEFNYSPIKTEKINKTKYKESLLQKLKEDKQKIDSKYKKKLEKIYDEKYDYIVSNIDSSNFYFDDTINFYFQNILKNIQEANPVLNKPEIKLYVSRATYPNASCLGEGSLIFNIGLLRYLKNESQIAFIICHEFAHYTQNHVMKATTEYLENLYSKETQEKLKEIKYSQFGTYTKAQEFTKAYVFDNRKHGRLHESEADSIAFLYLKNTKYDENEALTALALLDSTDTEKYRDSIQLNTFFDFKEFPFKSSWIAEEKKFVFLKDTVSEMEKDSLKTHPDCKKRVENLLKMKTISNESKSKYLQPISLFNKIVDYSDFECIENRLKYKNIDGAFYLTLKLIKKYPKNIYLQKTVLTCFDKLIIGLKNHNLNAYIDLPSPFQEGDYKVIVRFLNNIRISEAEKLKETYKNKYIN
jgi:Zn-dependent protease with chaperone function